MRIKALSNDTFLVPVLCFSSSESEIHVESLETLDDEDEEDDDDDDFSPPG